MPQGGRQPGRSDRAHPPLTQRLGDIQSALKTALDYPSAYYMLPVKSFHQTIANTFSAERYQRHVIDQGVEETFPRMIQAAFESMPLLPETEPIRLRLIGISLFHTALGLLADFPNENDFNRVLQFRDCFYGNPALCHIGLRRTRPFIGHITLAYIEKRLDVYEKLRLVDTIADLNAHIQKQPLIFFIRQTEPRWYTDLSAFERKPEYPHFSFVRENESDNANT